MGDSVKLDRGNVVKEKTVSKTFSAARGKKKCLSIENSFELPVEFFDVEEFWNIVNLQFSWILFVSSFKKR